MSATATRPDRSHATRRWWVVVWLPLLAISAAAVWYVVAAFVPHERSAAIEVWRGRLSAMADDRKAAITAWLGERLGNARVVAGDPAVALLLGGQRASPGQSSQDESPQHRLQASLDLLRSAYGYTAVHVLDESRRVVLTNTGNPPLEPACLKSVGEVLAADAAQVDFHADEGGLPMLAITAPVRAGDRTVGAVLLSVDPGRWLYPLLLSEPIPTRTGESLLAHQVGNQVEFLSPLRHRSAPLLSYRLPFTFPLLAVAAIRGEEGFRSYVDYRGVRVLGVARRIPWTGWGLVVKVDEDEAFSAFRRSVREVAVAWACVLLALAGLGFGAWRTQAASYRAHLGESEARFALLRDHANDAILFASRDGMILDVNRKAEEFYVRRREELLGLSFDELRASEERAALRDRVDALTHDDELVYEAVHRRSEGTRFPVEVSIRVADIGGQDVLVSIVRDITERKKAEAEREELEEKLRQSQKMEAVGQLAGGVAHDFNNLLQAMLSLTQVLLTHCTDPERVAADAVELEQHVKHGAALTRQLLLFSRRHTARPETLDLNEVVREAGKLLRRLLKGNIAVELRLTEGMLAVEADRGQLEQILFNLAVNGADAMPQGGQLVITTGSNQGTAWLQVADTGGGIPAGIRERIFEPFFTTKGEGRGTGLGLAVVHGIVAQHGGRIAFESREGQGTTFTITFPRGNSGEFAAVKVAELAGQTPAGRGERVLVVEDEATARDSLAEILTLLGYEVAAVGSGEEAGRLPSEPVFEVLLTDIMLPGIAGADLARELLERWPELKVILMSGYTKDEAMRQGISAGPVRFLQKPFGMTTLARELRSALDDAPAASAGGDEP